MNVFLDSFITILSYLEIRTLIYGHFLLSLPFFVVVTVRCDINRILSIFVCTFSNSAFHCIKWILIWTKQMEESLIAGWMIRLCSITLGHRILWFITSIEILKYKNLCLKIYISKYFVMRSTWVDLFIITYIFICSCSSNQWTL